MYNLYSMTRKVDAIRRLFGVLLAQDRTGNLLPRLPGPDQRGLAVAFRTKAPFGSALLAKPSEARRPASDQSE